MPKSIHRTRRRRAKALRSHTAGPDGGSAQRQSSTARYSTRGVCSIAFWTRRTSRSVVPRLQPELLHRVIQSCGLEDCGELVALATPDQLARIFDLDLWRAAQPGLDEQFDADRFGVWLEVLVESGATVAAQKLAEMDVDLVIAGLAQHARVFDRAAVTPYTTTDGEEARGDSRPRRWTRLRRRRLPARGQAHRLVGRDRRGADVPRRGASRLLPSGDARMPERFRTPGRRSMDWTTSSPTGIRSCSTWRSIVNDAGRSRDT